MFENIGGKIKTLAIIICWVGIVVSVIAAIVIISLSIVNHITRDIYLGVGILIAGPLVSWIGSFFVYGFGELIEKVSNIEDKIYSKPKTYTPVETNSRELKQILGKIHK
ncbi:MAG TPA: hypothetical protein P5087_03525 [Eubacteriales bacterium]|nr:hypothetical protein [Eubacteriales bacterium]